MSRRLALLTIVVLQFGCPGDEPPAPGCKEGHMVGDVCAGVPNDPVCGDDYCTQGVACTEVLSADSGAALTDAVSRATDGSCIALAAGAYPAVILPDGVSLLGTGADRVTIGGIETGGAGVRVRGLTVASGSLVVRAGDTDIDSVRISASDSDGVRVSAGASVVIRQSEVNGAQRYGVSAFDVERVEIESSIVDGGGISGPGLWAQCSSGCDCVGAVTVVMSNSKLVSNSVVGLSLVGAVANLDNVEVRGTVVAGFEDGGGIAASVCSEVTAVDLAIIDNADYGMLLDDSSLDADGLTVSGNLRGLWIQHVGMSMPGSTAVVRNATFSENRGVGVGIAGESLGVTIAQTEIASTRSVALPVEVNGVSSSSAVVGDGVTWKGTSQVVLDTVSIRDSFRASVLIDGPVASGSAINNLVLSGGDEAKGVLQQSLMQGEQQPAVTGSPGITATPDELHSVPRDIIPPTI